MNVAILLLNAGRGSGEVAPYIQDYERALEKIIADGLGQRLEGWLAELTAAG